MDAKKSKSTKFFEIVFTHLAHWIVKTPYFFIALIALITFGMLAVLPSIQLNNDGRVYFLEDDPMLVAQNRFEKIFGSEKIIMFFFETDEFYTPKGFKAVEILKEKLDKIEWEGEKAFKEVLDPFHAPALNPNSSDMKIAPLIEIDNPTQKQLDEVKKILINHPIYSKSITNSDGSIGAVIATMKSMKDDKTYSDHVSNAVIKIQATTPELIALNSEVVGPTIFGRKMDLITVQEAGLFGGLAVLVCIMVLLSIFRKVRQVLAAILVVVISTIWTLGAMAILGVEISLIHTILPPAIIITGLGSGIHVVNEYRLALCRKSSHDAIIESMISMGGPCFLTAITTGVGFLAMLTAPVHPMRTLGVFIALGVFLSFVLALVLVPSILAIKSSDEEDLKAQEQTALKSDIIFEKLALFVVTYKKRISISFFIMAIILSYGYRFKVYDTNFLHSLRADHELRQTIEYIDDKMGGSNSIELIFDTGIEEGIYDPEFLHKLEQLQRWTEENEKGLVWMTFSIVDLYKEIAYGLTGKRELPKTRLQALQYLELLEMNGGSVSTVTDEVKQLARMSARTKSLSSDLADKLEHDLRGEADRLFGGFIIRVPQEQVQPEKPALQKTDDDHDSEDELLIIEEEKDVEDDEDLIIIEDEQDSEQLKEPLQPIETVKPQQAFLQSKVSIQVAGSTPLFAKLNKYIIESQFNSFILATFIITFIMIILLRSVRLGLLIMIPNLLPVFSTYGLMGWLGVPIDFMSSVIGVAAIGVAVDGTIHIGSRFIRHRAMGESPDVAAQEVMKSVGRALVVTTAGLMFGFIVLAPSSMITLAYFGIFMSFCLFLAFLYDILMTPAVLAWLSPQNPDDKKTEEI